MALFSLLTQADLTAHVRWFAVRCRVSFVIWHFAKDDWYQGHFIPKGTICIPNMWYVFVSLANTYTEKHTRSMNRDPEVYVCPSSAYCYQYSFPITLKRSRRVLMQTTLIPTVLLMRRVNFFLPSPTRKTVSLSGINRCRNEQDST